MSRKPSKSKLNIYSYEDFRAYLKDLVQELKDLKPDLTMRKIADLAGFGSPSYLKMIIDGKRKLSEESFLSLCEVFTIKDKEKTFLHTLVNFNQCKDPDSKKDYLKLLNDLRPRVTFSK